MKVVRVGSRGSKLALAQTSQMVEALGRRHPDVRFDIEIIKTTGDKILDAPLSKIGGKGLFTKEIEQALADDRIDMAVHSMKDLPTAETPGLVIGATPIREDARDCLASLKGLRLADIPKNGRIATSSLRRSAQLRAARPDVQIVDVRGNLDTRIGKLRGDGAPDAMALAAAGLKRLSVDDIGIRPIGLDVMLPAVGQGALAIQIRKNDRRIKNIVAVLHDEQTAAEVAAERAFLAMLGGGCQVPVGAIARKTGDRLMLEGVIASLDGAEIYRNKIEGAADKPEEIGRSLADLLLGMGGRRVMESVMGQEGS